MKAKNAVRLSDNLVGVEVCNIKDVVKAQAAGLLLLNKEGEDYEYRVEDEESGEEREPTEQEVFDRIAKDIADDKEVYACMHISEDWCKQKNGITTMYTNFYVGQKVYLLRNNRIVEDEIISIALIKSEYGQKCKLVLSYNPDDYTQARCFTTKQGLIDYLMEK